MAYSGYLIKLGGSSGTELPMKYIKVEGYNITPNQRMESEAKRAITGVLYRTTVPHTASKIEFNTPNMTNMDVDAMMTLFRNNWTSSDERKIKLYYYDMESDSYKSGDFYMPDIQFPIDHIDNTNNIIYYKEIRIAFIEY
jgi:hypothetical protein